MVNTIFSKTLCKIYISNIFSRKTPQLHHFQGNVRLLKNLKYFVNSRVYVCVYVIFYLLLHIETG